MVEVMVAMSSSTAEVLRKGVRGRRHSVLESLALKSSLSICGGDGTAAVETSFGKWIILRLLSALWRL
jgi:hypothetical protein